MDEHLVKALYLGCYVLMLISAFSAFFSAYAGYESYASAVSDSAGLQDAVREDVYYESDGYLTGYEAAGLVLAKRRADTESLLKGIYSDEQVISGKDGYPDISVDGISYRDLSIKDMEPDGIYELRVFFDSGGRAARMELRSR